jgi:predicted transcriptional regulator
MCTHNGGDILQQVSDYELELMKIIWTNGGTAMYTDIVEGLEVKGNSWTKNTIITLLSRLVDKGILKTNKIGRRNKYTAVISADNYQADQTVAFLHKIFEGNTKGLVSTLIEKELLTAAEYEELKEYWKGGNTAK